MKDFTNDMVLEWLQLLAETFQEHKDELTELDRQIGDADHGLNMARGFTAVAGKTEGLKGQDIGSIFKTTAMTLISSVGGASGPLYGSFFLKASEKTQGKMLLTVAELADAFQNGLQSILALGKAQPGDKTMVDALKPAVEALVESENEDWGTALDKARQAAREGAESTIPLLAKKGRASYLGERSKGHKDPGSESVALLFDDLYTVMSR